jgi:hypothetical protein
MPGGAGARTPRGRQQDEYDRMGQQRTSPPPSRNGSPVKRTGFSSRVVERSGPGATRSIGRPADEIDRSGVVTRASNRTDGYSDRGPSWAASGPPSDGKSRAPRSYEDRGGQT